MLLKKDLIRFVERYKEGNNTYIPKKESRSSPLILYIVELIIAEIIERCRRKSSLFKIVLPFCKRSIVP